MSRRFHHELLRQARLDLGMSQEEAAAAVGVDVRTYRRYESGQVNTPGFSVRHPSRRQLLARMSSELGLDETELLVELDGAGTVEPASEPGGEAPEAPEAPEMMTAAVPASQAAWRPRQVHTLQRARHFVGRQDVLATLRAWHAAASPRAGVMALVGMGGAGKTALIERLLTEHAMRPDAASPGGVLVWSFFDNPRTEELLAEAVTYFAPPETTNDTTNDARNDASHATSSAAVTVESLERALAAGPPHLLVLDGLETVQSEGNAARAFGELEDPVLRRLLTACARGLGQSRVLVSSRFELSDLAAWEGEGLHTIRVEPLAESDGVALLRRWGVRGDGEALLRLHRHAGGHALSLAMTGSYLGTFLDGDPGRMDEISLHEAARDDALARRLHGVLAAYAAALTPRARDLLARLAALVEGADLDALVALARRGGALAGHVAGSDRGALQRELQRLRRLGLVFSPRPGVYSTHPFVRQYFRELLGDVALELRAPEAPALDGAAWSPPRDARLLDTYEALAEHALHTGRAREAHALYTRSMGGFGHLGLRLGDMIRGARVLRAFARGGEPAAMPAGLPAGARILLAYDWGLYSAALGDLAFAGRCYEACVEQARAANERTWLTTALRTLAYTERLAGALGSAREHVLASIEAARELARAGLGNDHWARGQALLAAICHDLGEVEAASRYFGQLAELGDTPMARRALWWAEHLVDTGQYDHARALAAANLRVCQELGWGGHAAHCHVVLGHVSASRGAWADASRHLEEAERWVQSTGEVEMQLRCRALRARVALAERRPADALREAENGRHLARTAGAGAFVDRLALLGAEAALAGGQGERAMERVRPVLASESAWSRADGHYLAGLLCQASGHRDAAAAHLTEAVTLRARLGHPGLEDAQRALAACAPG
jgi:transcriptional regulator with XRE-family HTH domain/tetratricopeptide (TPR) repeat protein